MIKKIFAILFLLMLVASAGDYQLPDTYVNGGLNVKNTTALNATTATTITASGMAKGADVTATDDIEAGDDARITGDISGGTIASNTTIIATTQSKAADVWATDDALIDDDLFVDGTATLNDVVINTTATITGKLATGLAPTYTHQDWSIDLSQSANADKTIYLVGNASANQTIVLDAVATANGKSYTFVTVTDPGTYYFILDGTGAETINGAANIASTALHDSITVYCDGVAWFVTSKIGTWANVVP